MNICVSVCKFDCLRSSVESAPGLKRTMNLQCDTHCFGFVLQILHNKRSLGLQANPRNHDFSEFQISRKHILGEDTHYDKVCGEIVNGCSFVSDFIIWDDLSRNEVEC